MSKNMTRKGLAISAAASLAAVGVAGVPANAAGLADKSFVSLETTVGKEYAVLAGDGETFSLTANEASTVTGGSVKFLVEDSEEKIVPTSASTDGVTQAIADADLVSAAENDMVVIDLDSAPSQGDGNYIIYADGDLTNDGDSKVMLKKNQLAIAHVFDDKVIFKSHTDLSSSADANISGSENAISITLVPSAEGQALTEQNSTTDVTGADDAVTLGLDFASTSDSVQVALTDAPAAGDYLIVSKSDFVIAANDSSGPEVVLAANTVTAATVDSSGNLKFTSAQTDLASTDVEVTADEQLVFIKGTASDQTTDLRASDGSYVVDSTNTASTSNEVLVLQDTTSDTVAVDVSAWVDDNGNSEIDSTEYTSETQTVTFIKASEVDVTSTITYPTPGDSSVKATLSLTPLLNEDQNMAAGDVQVTFTRPGATGKVDANATQNNSTRVWSATQSLVDGNWAGMPHIFQLASVDGDGGNADIYNTEAANNLAVGDTVIVDSDAAALDLSTGTAVAGVTDSDTFTTADSAGSVTDADDTGYVRVVKKDLSHVTVTSTVKTIETDGNHGLSIGDIVTVEAADADADATRAVVASVPTAKKFTIKGTGFTDNGGRATDAGDLVYVSFIEAVAGTYTAKGKVGGTALGNTSTNTSVSSTSDDTTIATTATVNVQGVSNDEVSTTPAASVREDETTVELTVSVVDKDDDAVTAGRPVVVTLGDPDAGGSRTGTFSVNGSAYVSPVTLTTDANGEVKFTVSDDDGAKGTQTKVTVVPENLSGAKTADIDLIWEGVVYSVFDLNDNSAASATGNNTVTAGGNYTYSLSVLDQWKEAPADGSHRIEYATTKRTVETGYLTLTSGAASYTVTDDAITGQTSIQTVFTLEELQSDGTWNADEELLNDGQSSGGVDSLTYTTSVVPTTQVDAVLLDTDGSTAYGNATADLSDAATTKETVEQDRRTTNAVKPSYGSPVVVSGRVANSVTNSPRGGAEVTISGPTNVLFSDGAVDSLGSLTLRADANGEFGVDLYSTTAQTDTVITVTSGADSETVKVSFTGPGASFGTTIDIDSPVSVQPGTSFKVTATLSDKNGNAVASTTGARMKVEYDGPGIVIATMPTDTNSKGQVSFTVLLGTNDSGTGVATVSYDQNDDADFKDSKDVVAAKTIIVGDAPVTQKVNAGSFKGYVAVYARGYEGQRLSAKIGNDWVIVDPIVNNEGANLHRTTDFTGAGVDIAVRIYIDRVLIDTINLTTK